MQLDLSHMPSSHQHDHRTSSIIVVVGRPLVTRQRRSQRDGLGEHPGSKPMTERCNGAHVDLHPQGLLEVGADLQDREGPGARLEVDQQVDIATSSLITPGDRPEDRNRATMVPSDDGLDLVPVSVEELPQRLLPDLGHPDSLRFHVDRRAQRPVAPWPRRPQIAPPSAHALVCLMLI